MSHRYTAIAAFKLLVVAFVSFIGTNSHSLAADKKPTPDKKASAKVTFDDHVKPIFRAKCFSCHNTDKKSGGLDLTNYTVMMQGGGSGASIEPGDVSASYLFSLVNHESEPFMPPKQEKLPVKMLATLTKWIEGGALENAGSKAMIKKPNVNLALKFAPSGKPATPPMPARLTLQPVVHTLKNTAVTALATSPWAPLVAVAGQKQIILYNTQSLEILGVLPFPEGIPRVLKFSRNGSLLLAGGGHASAQGRVIVWDIKTGKRIVEVGDELDSVLAADISADQSMIALGGPARMVRVYSTADGSLLYQMKKHTDWIYSIEFSPDGVLLATADRNGGMFIWEAFTGREYLSLKGHTKGITGLSWRIDSNILASCSEDATVRLWEMTNGRQVKSWGAHGGGAASVEFARDGRLVTCGRDRITKLWDQNGKQLRAFSAFSDLALRVTICDETNRVIAGDWTGTIRAWNAVDGKQLGELTSNPPKLDVRVTTATVALAAAQATQKAQAAAAAAAAAAANKVKANVAATTKKVADIQKQSQAATVTVTKTKATIAQLAKEIPVATKIVTDLTAVLPSLKEATAKGQEAAKKLAADKELAAVAATLQALLTKKSAALTAAQKVVTAKATALKTAQTQLAAADKSVKALAAALVATQKQVAQLTAAIKPATDKAAAAQNAATAAVQATTNAQNQLKKWQDALAFAKQLDQQQASTGK